MSFRSALERKHQDIMMSEINPEMVEARRREIRRQNRNELIGAVVFIAVITAFAIVCLKLEGCI